MGDVQQNRMVMAARKPALQELEVRDVAAIRAELSRARIVARAWADTIEVTRRTDSAALFSKRALEALAAKTVSLRALRIATASSFRQIDKAADTLAVSLGETAARLPLGEALHLITSLYPTLLPPQTRSELGAFYTPPALVKRLLDLAEEEGLDWRSARILDPATGGGAFLFQSIQRVIDAQPDCEPAFLLAQIGNRLTGFELDSHAAELAQRAVEIMLSDLAAAAGKPIPQIVRVCDALEADPDPVFDLVVGNPPYGRVKLSPAQRQRYARGLYGHANLYGVFTDLALRWARPGGLVGYVTPTSFLGGQYFASLRGLLADEAPPVAVDFVHARRGVFEDVLQETLLAVYKRGAKPARAQIHYLTVLNEYEAAVARNGTIALPSDPTSPWLAPRTQAHGSIIARAETMTNRLANWGYSVSTGPLVWNRFKDQLRNRVDGEAVYPLIWAEAVTSDGRFVYRARKRNHAPYFALKPGDEWLLVEKPCVIVQRTTAKEQARRLIAAELPASFVKESGGVIVENHLNMVRSKGNPKVPPAVIAALLNSRIVDELFRCISGSVAVSAFELEALPLPSPEEIEPLMRLVSARADASAIELECARLYGQNASR